MSENHKHLYKSSELFYSSVRNRNRLEITEIRKQKKEEILLAKRTRYCSNSAQKPDEGKGELSKEDIQLLAKNFQKRSCDSKYNLQKLRNSIITQDPACVEAFLSVPNSLWTLVGYLTGNDSDLQLEAAWCITNMCASDHKHTKIVVKAAAPYLITYLSSDSELLQDHCAWALGNMAGDSKACRELLKVQGILQPLTKLLTVSSAAVTQSAAFAITNMCRDQDSTIEQLLHVYNLADKLTRKLGDLQLDVHSVGELAWIMTYLTVDKDNSQKIVDFGAVELTLKWLVKLVDIHSRHVFCVTPFLRSLGNIFYHSHHAASIALREDYFMHCINKYLYSSYSHVVKESLWILSNFLAAGEPFVDVAIQANVLSSVVRLLAGLNEKIKKEAIICICNIVSTRKDQMDAIITAGAVCYFVDILQDKDTELICLTLQFIEMLLRVRIASKVLFTELNGQSYLEALAYSENEEIRNRTHYLLKTYLQTDDQS